MNTATEVAAGFSRGLFGTVKWFQPEKGYGYITADDGDEFFVHFTGITGGGYKSLNQGDLVTFDVEETPKGLKAVNVTVTEPNGERRTPKDR